MWRPAADTYSDSRHDSPEKRSPAAAAVFAVGLAVVDGYAAAAVAVDSISSLDWASGPVADAVAACHHDRPLAGPFGAD